MEKNNNNKSRTITCEKCNGVIEYQGDAVVTSALFRVVVFHERCFASEIKGFKSIFLNNTPINGSLSNLATIFYALGGVICLFIPDMWPATLIFLIPISFRAYAWFKIERHLK